MDDDLARSGVLVEVVEKRGRGDVIGYLTRLRRVLKRLEPAVIYAYLDVANLLATFARLWLPGTKVVWGIRCSDLNLDDYDWLTALTYRSSLCLAWMPDLLIFNSEAGLKLQLAHGTRPRRYEVIPNGIDSGTFRFDQGGRRRVRAELGIQPDEVVIGLVARLDAMKDHRTFLQAAARFVQEGGNARFACVGGGPVAVAELLRRECNRLGLGAHVLWLGERRDLPSIYSALDLHTSSSAFGEAFSNAVGEAMACGVANVVTDVGDARTVVGDTGIVVPPRDASALCRGWRELLSLPRADRSRRARARIEQLFSMNALTERTADAVERLFDA
jgi:glycosyltransferase involved in cell wall biosynthesis